ncbi:MAG: hypothetical protein JJT78_17160 [Leptospira sp.]|nr:hypothetical protein [Leptospira sp.]
MKTTVHIQDDLYKSLKIKAAQENRKIMDLMNESIRLYLGIGDLDNISSKVPAEKINRHPLIKAKNPNRKKLFEGMTNEKMERLIGEWEL